MEEGEGAENDCPGRHDDHRENAEYDHIHRDKLTIAYALHAAHNLVQKKCDPAREPQASGDEAKDERFAVVVVDT